MGEQKNTITINGKIYDALSGALLKDTSAPDNKLVSDFINAPSKPLLKPVARKASRTTQHIAHHKPQKSITLKRAPVVKPESITSARSTPIASTGTITAKAEKNVFIGKDRYDRAKNISKSTAVSKFSISAEPTVNKYHQPLPVQPAPQAKIGHPQPMPIISETSAKSSEDMFNAALSQTESHKLAPIKLSSRPHRLAKKIGMSARAANIAATVVVVVAISSFIAYQNVSNISMSFAASQSGVVGASLPGFLPAGFSLSHKVTSNPGQIVLSYKSNSDDRAFTITQSSSNWNSQTLADSYLSDKQVQQTIQSNGKTIYIYNQSNATWVDGGIWYRIEGNSSLTTDQLLKISASF